MENDNIELKAECWDIIYPALIFLNATDMLPEYLKKDLKRAMNNFNKSEKLSEF